MQPAKQQLPIEQPATAPDPIAGGCYTRNPRTGVLTKAQPDAGTGAAHAPADNPTTQQE